MISSFLDGRVFGQRYESPASAGPRVLALHGWARDHHDFDALLKGLPAIAVDLPGFGASPAPETALGTAEYAAQLAPLLGELDSPHVVLGHSYGGRVAVQMAAQGLVDRLVLVGTPLLRPPAGKPSAKYRLVRWAHARGLYSDARMEALRERSGSADYRAARGVMRDILVKAVNEGYAEQLQRITCPVDIVVGAGDTAARPEMAAQAARLCSAELTVVPDAGHMLDPALAAVVREKIEAAL